MKAQKGEKGVCFRCWEKNKVWNHDVTHELKIVRLEGPAFGDPPAVSERAG